MKNFNPSALVDSTPVLAHRSITPAQNRQLIKARFDNQVTTDYNRNLWSMADLTSVDAAANSMVRRTLRMRGRYAYHNNPWVIGPANRLAKFVIGPKGPRLHLATRNKQANELVEAAWERWAKRVGLARKLRTSRAARFYNGEGFNLLRTNPKLKGPVKLDVFEVEADQVSSPLFGLYPAQYPDQYFDGVRLDPWGNREVYHVLRQHPGAFGAFLMMGYEFDPWPAQYVLHDYARLRPAQQRGIPEVTPALELFEELRGYRKSVQAAARTASDWAGFMKTTAPPNPDGSGGGPAPDTGWGTQMDYVDVKRGQFGVLPENWEPFQMKAEQPATGYDSFQIQTLIEASQVLDMPLFILAGDARLANMSSAYVATGSFVQSVETDREEYDVLLDQTFDEWLLEARRVPGMIPRDFDEDPDHTWRWPQLRRHADPQKMAGAENQRLKNGSSCPSIEVANNGGDFEELCIRAAADYGVSVPEYKAALFQSTFAGKGTPPPASIVPGTGTKPDAGDNEDEEDDELE